MAGTLAAQSFIQMSHPQFGMYTKNANFEHETVNFEFAIANANRLKPAFVVITGDLINDAKSGAQAAEYKRISAKLDTNIRLYRVAGNRDAENEPTKESLARYRERPRPALPGGAAGGVLRDVPRLAHQIIEWLSPGGPDVPTT
jgi:predicted MPP superfamily phosphohydrolase